MKAYASRSTSRFGRRLRDLMSLAGLTPRELDRRSGVSSETIRNALRGKTRAMTDANLRLVAAALDASLSRTGSLDELRGAQ